MSQPPALTPPRSATEVAYARIWDAIERIPPGRVATYGQVAEVAGYVRRPRLTAQALRHVPGDRELPWFRVINAQGRIAIPPGTRGHREQQLRLQAEGVKFVNGRVDLALYRWRPWGDAPLVD